MGNSDHDRKPKGAEIGGCGLGSVNRGIGVWGWGLDYRLRVGVWCWSTDWVLECGVGLPCRSSFGLARSGTDFI